ncbi:MAG: molybdopterin-dependent oxidoreductase [Phycisphaerae bacterium]|nr:molybdopterin-dependent oxidoreductase [Phycisphaerae bacterium]
MDNTERIAREHSDVTRRYFLQIGAVGAAALSISELWAAEQSGQTPPLLAEAISKLGYLTREEDFKNYGRGKPKPHTLGPEKLREVGLVRDTWWLEVLPDRESNSEVERPLSRASGNALDFAGLMKLAETRTVRFMSVMTCTNGRSPCGMGLWEGVPMREVVWLARPKRNVRRAFYYGYHNDDPAQRFQSSLPIGRVLEDPPGEHPVILCYKLNNEWLTPVRGGPVRVIVPEEYGNRSVKWLQRIMLTNSFKANDTYAEWNNDTVSHLKTCARFIHTPEKIKAGEPAAITGVAQVGMSGLSKVQYWLSPQGKTLAKDDPYFSKGQWKDADILPPPDHWGGGLEDGKLPPVPSQIDAASGKPHEWPMRNAFAHWATLITAPRPGKYDLRCRTIDSNGVAQPMPRPFAKSGHNAIQKAQIVVEA